MTEQLVGAAEIAKMFGVTRQAVDALVRRRKDFPRPIAEISAGRIWERRAIEEWAAKTGRLGKGEADPPTARPDG